MAKFVVIYCGEYDVDEWGNPVSVTQEFDSYEEAVESACDWERVTGQPAPIRVRTTD